MFSIHVDTARTWRGGQNQVLLTVLGLRARGHRAALVAHPRGELFRRVADGRDLYPIAQKTELDLHAAWNLSCLLRDLQPDVVHAHDAHAVTLAVLARSLTGLVTSRLMVSRRVDFHVGKNAASRWIYRQVDRFLCASSAIQSILIEDGIPASRTRVVYEGIDLARITAAPPVDAHAEFGLPAGAPIVGNVAALVPHKGQRYLVDAAARVVQTIPGARFLVVGDGELETRLSRQLKQLGLEGHVILTGFRSDVLSLHKSFDLFVMSSLTEGLGTSVLDAMACGRPVVGTKAGGIPESISDGQTGLLVPVRDAPALAEAIIRLLRDPSLSRAFGNAGRNRVRDLFSAERMVDETVACYSESVDTDRATDIARPPGAG